MSAVMEAIRHHALCGVTCHGKCTVGAAKRLIAVQSGSRTTKSPKDNQNQKTRVAAEDDRDDHEGGGEPTADEESKPDVSRANTRTFTVLCVRGHAHHLCMRAELKAIAATCWSIEPGTYEDGGPSTEHTSCAKARDALRGDEYLAQLLTRKVRLLLLPLPSNGNASTTTTTPSTIATINNTVKVYTMKTLESSLFEKVSPLCSKRFACPFFFL
jgi:hypothetical protein